MLSSSNIYFIQLPISLLIKKILLVHVSTHIHIWFIDCHSSEVNSSLILQFLDDSQNCHSPVFLVFVIKKSNQDVAKGMNQIVCFSVPSSAILLLGSV